MIKCKKDSCPKCGVKFKESISQPKPTHKFIGRFRGEEIDCLAWNCPRCNYEWYGPCVDNLTDQAPKNSSTG